MVIDTGHVYETYWYWYDYKHEQIKMEVLCQGTNNSNSNYKKIDYYTSNLGDKL